jgi:hypothetical protein
MYYGAPNRAVARVLGNPADDGAALGASNMRLMGQADRCRRDRAGYPRPYSRNDLRRQGQYADDVFGLAFGYTLDGRPFGDEPIRVREAGPYETRFPTKDSEFEIVARALAGLGATDLAFETTERPDWKIRFPNGDVIGAEASEIDLTADFTNRLLDLKIALLEAVDAEPGLPIGERSINFTFGPLAFQKVLNAGALPPKARRALVSEMLEYLRAGDFATGRITGYATLERYELTAYISESDYPHVDLLSPATLFSPRGPLSAAIARVGLKIERAKKYDQRDPLWLFLHITDMMGEFTETVTAFGELKGPIAPFQAIFLSDGRSMSVLR